MSQEIKDLLQKQNESFYDFKKEMEKGKEADQSKLAKIEAELDKYEAKNQGLVVEIENEKKSKLEIEERLMSFEKMLLNVPASKQNEVKEEMNAFNSFLKSGEKGLSQEDIQKFYLRTDINTDGGYLVPVDYRNELLKNITEISPVRNVARIITTTRGTVEIPTRTAISTASWVGEGGTQSESNSTYGLSVINTKELSVFSVATYKMLNDSAFNIADEIRKDVTEAFAKAEGTAFVDGSGVNQPEGFMTNASVAEINSGNATAITADSLIEVAGELKSGYNPIYGLNRKTLASVRRLKTGDGQYLWMPGIAAGQPNTINGYPYIEMPDLDDEAGSAYPVIFGDFARAYYIVDGMSLRMIRDDNTQATSGKVRFIFIKSVGAKVVLPEALKKIKCSV